MLESSNQGRTWFVKEIRITTRRSGIGRSYDALRFASALASVVSRNPVHEESRANVARMLGTALDALASGARPDAVHLKSLYLFARDEGYPVQQEWMPSLPRRTWRSRGRPQPQAGRPGFGGSGRGPPAHQPRGLPRREHRDHHPVKFDLDQRRARMSVGDLSDFSIGPKSARSGAPAASGAPSSGRTGTTSSGPRCSPRGPRPTSRSRSRERWRAGAGSSPSRGGSTRSSARAATPSCARSRPSRAPLPMDEASLRGDYPEYFVQLAAYAALRGAGERCELIFVETDTGLAQTVSLEAGGRPRFSNSASTASPSSSTCACAPGSVCARWPSAPRFAVAREGQAEAAVALRTALQVGTVRRSSSKRRPDSARRAFSSTARSAN
jgi:hypothetical protein